MVGNLDKDGIMDTKLLDLVKSDEELKSIINELINDKSITKDYAYNTIVKYLASKDINVSKEDLDNLLKNNSKVILNNKMSDQELDSINGGVGDYGNTCPNAEQNCHYSANYFMRSIPGCSATVEFYSWCGSDDQCKIWDVVYDWVKK